MKNKFNRKIVILFTFFFIITGFSFLDFASFDGPVVTQIKTDSEGNIFTNYIQIRKELVEGVKNLTREQLDWTPPGHENSIAKLLAHIAEAEYWWIHVVAEGKVAQKDADSDAFTGRCRPIFPQGGGRNNRGQSRSRGCLQDLASGEQLFCHGEYHSCRFVSEQLNEPFGR